MRGRYTMNMKHIGIALAVCAVMLFFAGCGKAGNVTVMNAGQVQAYAGVWADIYE
jgi:hypothetical protein